MIKKLMMWTVAALVVVALSAPALFAASPSERQCEASGGTFNRDGGQVSCTTTDFGKNTKFTDTTTQESNGTLQNDPQYSESQACGGTGSGKCPPGQFK